MNQLCPRCFHAIDSVLDDFETAEKRITHKTKAAPCVVLNKFWSDYVERQKKMDSWQSQANVSQSGAESDTPLGKHDDKKSHPSPAENYYPGCV